MNNIYAKSLNAFLNHKWWSIPIVVILFRLHRLFLANHPLRTFSIGRPFIHFDQYTCTGRSYLRVHPRLYGPSGRHGRHVGSRAASPLTVRANNSNGYITVLLPDIKDRERSQMEIADVLSKNVRGKTEARAFVQQQSTFGGRRAGMPVQYVLQATSLEKLTGVFARLYAEGKRKPGVPDGRREPEVYETRSPYRDQPRQSFFIGRQHPHDCPDTTICIERPAYGIFLHERETVSDIGRNQPPAAQHAVGPEIHLCPQRCRRDDPAGQPRHIERRRCPPQLYRYNRFVSATVSSGLNKGYTIGDGLDEMDRIASETLDNSFRTALSGESKEFRESSSSLMFAMILALFMIYLVLAAQFESFKRPVGRDVHGSAGYCRGVDLYELFRYNHEYIQSDRYHHADRSGGEKTVFSIVEFANQRQEAD